MNPKIKQALGAVLYGFSATIAVGVLGLGMFIVVVKFMQAWSNSSG